MAFVAKYNVAGGKILTANLKVIIDRDQREALDLVGGTNVLGLCRLQKATRVVTDPPYLTLQLAAWTPTIDDNEESITSLYEYTIFFAIGGNDPEALADQLEEYKLAFFHILSSASEDDLTDNMTAHDRPILETGQTRNGEVSGVREKNGRYFRTAELDFTIEIKET